MFLKNPRLVAIVEKIKAMNLDQLAEHIEMYKLESQVVDIIYKDFAHRRSLCAELLDIMGYLKMRTLFKCKVTSPDAIENIKKFLIQHLKERENVGKIARTDQNESHRSVEQSEPGRVEV